jgi:hypothetical protein
VNNAAFTIAVNNAIFTMIVVNKAQFDNGSLLTTPITETLFTIGVRIVVAKMRVA